MALCMSKSKYHKSTLCMKGFKIFSKSTQLSHCDAVLKHNKHLKNIILKHATNRIHIYTSHEAMKLMRNKIILTP